VRTSFIRLARTVRPAALVVLGAVIGAGVAPTLAASINGGAARDVTALSHVNDSGAAVTSAAAGPWHVVGATGQPKFANYGACHWGNFDSVHSNAAYLRDPSGFVHLKGTVLQTPTHSGACDFDAGKRIFILPPGYRPARREATVSFRGDSGTNPPPAGLAIVIIDGPQVSAVPAGSVSVDPQMSSSEKYFSLDTISFRCAPSGSNGCP
jgi:hypothetical protein